MTINLPHPDCPTCNPKCPCCGTPIRTAPVPTVNPEPFGPFVPAPVYPWQPGVVPAPVFPYGSTICGTYTIDADAYARNLAMFNTGAAS